VDSIVVGAGTAGAVVAGRLAASTSDRTLLLEAGPDYGPADSGRWPDDLLDATKVAQSSHDWGYTGEFGGKVIRFNRARVVGGCSAHNAGAVVFGSRFDYDGWAAAGNPGWSARELLPLFTSAWRQLRVRRVGLDELTPFQRVFRDAIVADGIPAVKDFNDLDQNAGVAPFPVNIDGVTRVNSAFAYVDPVRDRLIVAGDAPVERVLVRGGRAVGVAVRDGQRLTEIGASRVVLSCGAYGSPAVLLRSGIGPADELTAIGVKPVLDLPGVGRNLHDQPCLEVRYEGSDELIERMERHQARTGWRPDEQVIAKLPSTGCRQGFDLHIYAVGGGGAGGGEAASNWYWILGVACLTPLSRGSVRLTGPGLDDQLVIDHRYLSDSGRYDRARLVEGVERVREVAGAPELRRLLGRETSPGPEVCGRQAIDRFLDHAAVHYYHPVGSCKMGPASDPDSVVDAEGRVHGIEGLYVTDASLMPTVTSGNTNMPTAVIGERIAQSLLARLPGCVERSGVVERDAGARPDGARDQHSAAAQARAGLRTQPAGLGLPLAGQVDDDLAVHRVRADGASVVNDQPEVRGRTRIHSDERALARRGKLAADDVSVAVSNRGAWNATQRAGVAALVGDLHDVALPAGEAVTRNSRPDEGPARQRRLRVATRRCGLRRVLHCGAVRRRRKRHRWHQDGRCGDGCRHRQWLADEFHIGSPLRSQGERAADAARYVPGHGRSARTPSRSRRVLLNRPSGSRRSNSARASPRRGYSDSSWPAWTRETLPQCGRAPNGASAASTSRTAAST
jgi:choline dehydrogenase